MIVDSDFSATVVILIIAEMFMLFEMLGGYGWVHGSLGDGEFVRSQLGYSHNQKWIHTLIRGIQNSTRVGLGLHLPWCVLIVFV